MDRKMNFKAFTFFFAAFCFVSKPALADLCSQIFDPLAFQVSLNSFKEEMTKNPILREDQAEVVEFFEFYKLNYFGKHPQSNGWKTLKDIFLILKQYPELSKTPMREQIIEFTIKEYNQSQKFEKFLTSFKKSGFDRRNNLVQIEANKGYWGQILGIPPVDKGLSKKKQKILKKQRTDQIVDELDQWIKSYVKQQLADPLQDNRLKMIALYGILKAIRKHLLDRGLDVKYVSQAIVDLVDTAGFGDKKSLYLFKSPLLRDNLKSVQNIFSENNHIAVELGFENVQGLAQFYNVKYDDNFAEQFEGILTDFQNETPIDIGQRRLRLRALSLYESPFRSCLSGDCASETYFSQALDPNFIYFTLTSEDYQSSGYIAVVLGHAKNEKREMVKTAFVDKIQGVSQDDILPMLEGIRLSVKEQGYLLGLPIEIGEDSGLSNTYVIRDYVDTQIMPSLNRNLKDFKPHENPYSFYWGSTRAYDAPQLFEFEERILEDVRITAGEIYPPKPTSSLLNKKALFEFISPLKGLKQRDDHIQFIRSLSSADEIKGLKIPKSMIENYLRSIIRDKNLDFLIRKEALFGFFLMKIEVIRSSYEYFIFVKTYIEVFNDKEQKQILEEMSQWENKVSETILKSLFDMNLREMENILDSKWAVLFDQNRINNSEFSPLMYYIKRKKQEHALLLLKKGEVNLAVQNKNGQTALSLAVYFGLIDLVGVLVEKGADVNVKDRWGDTPLMEAAAGGHEEIVLLLIEKGADVLAVNDVGRTARGMALEDGYYNISFLLNKAAFRRDFQSFFNRIWPKKTEKPL